MVVKGLDLEEMQVEAGVTLTKIRWGRRSQGVEDLTQDQARQVEEVPTEEEMSVAEARDVLSMDGRQVDMGRKRPTDQKNNRNVRMPAPGPAAVEAELNTRMGAWVKLFMDFRKSRCDENGVQNESNLTPGQMLGLKSLSQKVARLELIILEADKGKTFVVTDEETYRSMAEDHTGKDRPTTPE